MEGINNRIVLIVEDQPFFRKVYSDRLEMEGYRVISAEDGNQALNLLKDNAIHLVVTDIMMPVMDGRELIEEMKKDEALRSIPIIAMSVLSEEDNIDEVKGLGADDYVVKGSSTPGEVVAKIGALINQSL